MVTYDAFFARLESLRSRVRAACVAACRPEGAVTILPVTKTHPVEAALHAARAGLPAVGENRVQEAGPKRTEATAAGAAALRWELIGHLQSNKARAAAETFDRIQSVDSEKLVRLLDRAAAEAARPLRVLLQVNAGRDPAKSGCEPEDAARLLDTALAAPGLRVEGLMTIAPLGQSPAETADHALRTFAALRLLRDELAASRGVPLPELSMGMSGDVEQAVACGSTCVRVGSALYGAR